MSRDGYLQEICHAISTRRKNFNPIEYSLGFIEKCCKLTEYWPIEAKKARGTPLEKVTKK